MKKNRRIWVVSLILFVLSGVPVPYAFDRVVTLGRSDKWKSINRLENLKLIDGRQGFKDIILKDAEYTVSEDTDLLVHFNSEEPYDSSGHYRLSMLLSNSSKVSGGKGSSVTILSNRYKVYGSGSAAFFSERGGLGFIPERGSLFFPRTVWNDFTLEFWIYPAQLSDGEEILEWHDTLKTGSRFITQSLLCSVSDRRLRWNFRNFFHLPEGEGKFLGSVTLKGLTGLIPREWSHHLIRFDSKRGMLEYLVNGRIEDIQYATSTGEEGGDIYLPVTGEASSSPVVLGGNYTGFMDEVRFSRKKVERPRLKRYLNQSGKWISGIIDFKYSGTRLKRITAVYDQPEDSAIYFYYRLSDRAYMSNDLSGKWKRFVPGQRLPVSERGRYLQLRAELFPNGKRSLSPVLSEIHVFYEPDLPPAPPSSVYAEPGDRSITLYWEPVNEEDVAGYLVYYGDEPGNYLGVDSDKGKSPIDVGKVDHFTITGLVNGRLYSFAVVTYDSSKPPHRSAFSNEVTARPSEIYK